MNADTVRPYGDSYMAMKGRAERAEALLADDERVRKAVRHALDAWLYCSDTSERSWLLHRDEAAVAEDVVRFLAARNDGEA